MGLVERLLARGGTIDGDGGVSIKLTDAEMDEARLLADERRRILSQKTRILTAEYDLYGTVGELAVSLVLYLPWTGKKSAADAICGDLRRFKKQGGRDVYPFEVRAGRADHFRLTVHETAERSTTVRNDVEGVPFIWVISGGYPWVKLMGWIEGTEHYKKRCYWEEPHGPEDGCFFVPNSALRPAVELLVQPEIWREL